MPEPQGKPPAGELGRVVETFDWGLPGIQWSSFQRAIEETPELKWPTSVRSTRLMMNDSQPSALYAMTTLPIRSYDWRIDPNGCDEKIVRHVAGDVGLPILGEDGGIKKRSTLGFSFKRHLYHGLKTLIPGHEYFEMSGEVLDDGLWHLKRLGFRPPETIEDFDVAEDGTLRAIKQRGKVFDPIILKANRLVYYLWDAEDGDFVGRSMLRSCYRDWLIKDRLLRVNAINIERGGGIPWVKNTDPRSGRQQRALAETARDWKVDEQGGASLPPGSDLKIEKASTPDAIASVRYHDESMARAWLAMFAMLGQTETGSRALGGTFVDFFGLGQRAIADDLICDTFNDQVIARMVEWNYGKQDSLPLLSYEVPADVLPVTDVISLVEAGLIVVDDEVRAWLAQSYNLPAQEIPEEQPQAASFGYDLDSAIVTIDERRAQLGLPPRSDGKGALTVPEFLAQFGGTSESAVKPGSDENPPAEAPPDDAPAAEAGSKKKRRHSHAAADDSVGHRQPYAHEINAAVDFDEIEERFQENVASLLEIWQSEVKADQVTAITAAIEAANGDLDALAEISVDSIGADVLSDHLVASYGTGQSTAIDEADSQGVALDATPDSDVTALAEDRGSALGKTLTAGLVLSASTKAISLSASGSIAPAEVATQTAAHLESLTDSAAAKSIKGAVQSAFNGGRFDAMSTVAAGVAVTYYASELLDANTCSPCAQNDGKEYESLEALMEEYPSGFVDCEGGDNCRGTGIAEYGEGAADG